MCDRLHHPEGEQEVTKVAPPALQKKKKNGSKRQMYLHTYMKIAEQSKYFALLWLYFHNDNFFVLFKVHVNLPTMVASLKTIMNQ